MDKFVKVTNNVLNMSLRDIMFDNSRAAKSYGGKSAEMTLFRLFSDSSRLVWTLRKDSVCVRKKFVDHYELDYYCMAQW